MPRTIPAALLVALTTLSCGGPSVHFTEYASGPPPQFCDPVVFEKDQDVPPGATLYADIGLGETGFSGRCSVGENKARLRTQACKIGADAIKIVAENYPNFVSTCYRVRAKLYKLAPQPPEAMPPPSE